MVLRDKKNLHGVVLWWVYCPGSSHYPIESNYPKEITNFQLGLTNGIVTNIEIVLR